jgi:hypothetical protein
MASNDDHLMSHRQSGSIPGMPRGEYVDFDNGRFYCIRDFDRMAPFFVSLVSGSDHWLFVSSCGALTAGRVDADSAIFPYYTADKLRDARESAGSLCAMFVEKGEAPARWEPFAHSRHHGFRVERNLYRNTLGSRLVFEEINHDLGLTHHYAWLFSNAYGLVRQARIVNHAHSELRIRLLDGVRNILPSCVSSAAQLEFSNLLDAYKCSERITGRDMAVYALTARLSDRPVPGEALLATTAWQAGLDAPTVLLSDAQVDAFFAGGDLCDESVNMGRRGAFLMNTVLDLAPDETRSWSIAVDVNRDASAVIALRERLADAGGLLSDLKGDIDATDRQLRRHIAAADGLQCCAEETVAVHHAANVMYNIMRGGLPADGYRIRTDDWRCFVAQFNAACAAAHSETLDALPSSLSVEELREVADASGSEVLARLARQYLPFTFSRRHGDPTRPWNRFAIKVRNPDGTPRLAYEGNWRDIFQNWEALGTSFPAYLENFIALFLCATTADGYNSLCLSESGIAWECFEPDAPWAAFGYWSDHQIIYLLRLLEAEEAFYPGKLAALLNRPLFTCANVPYRIKPYGDLLLNPRDSLVFDADEHRAVEERVSRLGADGRLLLTPEGAVVHVTMAEKLLVLLLAKLTNLVPGGGIWMNTQRPEWNDSNNALAGYGLSVVTTCYLHRYLCFLQELFPAEAASVRLTETVADWLEASAGVLERFDGTRGGDPVSDAERRAFMDAVGEAGAAYRQRVYTEGLSPACRDVPVGDIRAFLANALACVRSSIRANRRTDDLYHAYNILQLTEEGAGVLHLHEMLEGQVAALSSGMLDASEALAALEALRDSALYREDQQSYLLNPRCLPPTFLERNNVPPPAAAAVPFLKAMLDAGDTRLVKRDVTGGVHFNGAFANRDSVLHALDELRRDPRYAAAVDSDADNVLDLFEETFNHLAYLGRAGSMFAYEGVGSIYWHMVSKLLLAAKECAEVARVSGAPQATGLAACYDEIRAGLGFNKSPQLWGGFPTDPYSHTPWGRGAAQPGMTGQVKEEVLTRFSELGVAVTDGRVTFDPRRVPDPEFLSAPRTFDFIARDGGEARIDLPVGALAFTFCQVPIVYRSTETAGLVLTLHDGTQRTIQGHRLDADTSRAIFDRDGSIARIEVT